MLVKPQDLNQARLYAIETRIKEGEENKMKEADFFKETIKKLIYAIEQQQIATVKAVSVPNLKEERPKSKEYPKGTLVAIGNNIN